MLGYTLGLSQKNPGTLGLEILEMLGLYDNSLQRLSGENAGNIVSIGAYCIDWYSLCYSLYISVYIYIFKVS